MAFPPTAAVAIPAAAGKAGKTAATAATTATGFLADSASKTMTPGLEKIFQDPLSFKQRLGLAAVSGGLGAIGDILKEQTAGAQAIKMKQTPANSRASTNAAAIAPIPPRASVQSGQSFQPIQSQPMEAGQQKLIEMQDRVKGLMAGNASPQLKLSRLGAGGFNGAV